MYDRIQIPLLSLADMCRELAELTGSRIVDHDGKYIAYAGPGMFYSKNFILNASANEIEPIIKEIRSGLSKGMPAGISFTTECMPDNIEEVLKENGFQKFISQTGMIFDFDQDFNEDTDPNIRELGADRLPEWCTANSEGFPKPREDETYVELIKSRRLITYGYMCQDKIASTGMLLIHPEISGIHEISTLPDYRRQGQARAIICHMLKELKSRNINSVSLQASDAGKLVYETIGFKTVSTIPTWVPAGGNQ